MHRVATIFFHNLLYNVGVIINDMINYSPKKIKHAPSHVTVQFWPMIPIIFSSVTDGQIIIDFAFDHFLSIVCFFISIGDQRRAEDTV
jgi:hypothetical protein